MANFEDWLWSELACDDRPIASQVAPALRTTARRRARRPPALLTGAFAGLAALVLTLVLTAGSSAPAFAVTRNTDGSVTVTLQELSAAPAANAQLAKIGVPVEIANVEAGCQQQGTRAQVPQSLYPHILQVEAPTGPDSLSLTIDPAEIPVGDTLVLAATLSPAGNDAAVIEPTNGKMIAVGHFALYQGTPPTCQPPADE